MSTTTARAMFVLVATAAFLMWGLWLPVVLALVAGAGALHLAAVPA